MYKVLGFVVLVCALNILAFVLIPEPLDFMFTSDAWAQPYRFISFQFIHMDMNHLIENVIGFIVIGLIATELDLGLKEFALAYFFAIFLIIPLALLISVNQPLAGNSTGIYGALAFSLVKCKRLIPLKFSIPAFIFFIFPASLLNISHYEFFSMDAFQSEFYHFIGFLGGITSSFTLRNKTKNILRI